MGANDCQNGLSDFDLTFYYSKERNAVMARGTRNVFPWPYMDIW